MAGWRVKQRSTLLILYTLVTLPFHCLQSLLFSSTPPLETLQKLKTLCYLYDRFCLNWCANNSLPVMNVNWYCYMLYCPHKKAIQLTGKTTEHCLRRITSLNLGFYRQISTIPPIRPTQDSAKLSGMRDSFPAFRSTSPTAYQTAAFFEKNFNLNYASHVTLIRLEEIRGLVNGAQYDRYGPCAFNLWK